LRGLTCPAAPAGVSRLPLQSTGVKNQYQALTEPIIKGAHENETILYGTGTVLLRAVPVAYYDVICRVRFLCWH
ncbi:hypothetical protein, partial [Bacillus sp. SJS]|uniref:hypothetical protein n=1 Tax=Bacillus sp. SJS TaxID=1423321 RepID=UPI000553FF40